MKSIERLDLMGIGIGPFNLSLAALCESHPELKVAFIDRQTHFDWHPGINIPGTRMQVPYYADLVTLADPCNPFTYMAYLKHRKQMFRFGILEQPFVTRTEYTNYCQWVAGQLPSLHWGENCLRIEKYGSSYKVTTSKHTYIADRIILGTGTIPDIPSFVQGKSNVIHSSVYLRHRQAIMDKPAITLIGSGQSAAEIFHDLIQIYQGRLRWFTRSSGFRPMDYTKFALEKTSPDYIRHFYSLNQETKDKVLHEHGYIYKGINAGLLDKIYELLYELDSPQISMHPSTELTGINDQQLLLFRHKETKTDFSLESPFTVLATGYKHETPSFLRPAFGHINWLPDGRYAVNPNYSIDRHDQVFIQHGDVHSHGFNATDLTMVPYRNMLILNTILGSQHYITESDISFQKYGPPY